MDRRWARRRWQTGTRRSIQRVVRWVLWGVGRLRALEQVVAPTTREEQARGWGRLVRDLARASRLRELDDVAVARGLMAASGHLPVGSLLEGLVDQAVERLCRARRGPLPHGPEDDPCMFSAEAFGEEE